MLGLSPPPEESLLDLGAGQDALEAELVHIDEQLMNIEDDLGHIDEAFIMMDQQLAESISEDVYDTADNEPELSLDNLGVEQEEDGELANPFDDWQRDALADMIESRVLRGRCPADDPAPGDRGAVVTPHLEPAIPEGELA